MINCEHQKQTNSMGREESVQRLGVGGWRGGGHGHGQVFSRFELGPLLQRVEVHRARVSTPPTYSDSLHHFLRQGLIFNTSLHEYSCSHYFQSFIHNTFEWSKPKAWLRSPLSKDPLKGTKCYARSLPHLLSLP